MRASFMGADPLSDGRGRGNAGQKVAGAVGAVPCRRIRVKARFVREVGQGNFQPVRTVQTGMRRCRNGTAQSRPVDEPSDHRLGRAMDLSALVAGAGPLNLRLVNKSQIAKVNERRTHAEAKASHRK